MKEIDGTDAVEQLIEILLDLIFYANKVLGLYVDGASKIMNILSLTTLRTSANPELIEAAKDSKILSF